MSEIKSRYFSSNNSFRLYILSVIVGFFGGSAAWLFHETIEFIEHLFIRLPYELFHQSNLHSFAWIPFLFAPALGGLIVGLINNRLPEELKGHGIPNVIESLNQKGGKMSPHTPLMKLVTAAFTLGSGGSAGHEGPIAQIGGGLGSYLGQKFNFSPKELRALVLAGVAAGISAIFNAPIGGLLFALEVVKRKSTINVLIPVIIGSITGSITGHYVFGLEPALSVAEELPLIHFSDIPLFILLGLIGGIISTIWIFFFFKTESLIAKLFTKCRFPSYIWPCLGGFAIGLILIADFILMDDNWEKFTVMGVSFEPMQALLNDTIYSGSVSSILLVLFILFFLKAFSTAITIGSGGSGGLFTPTLFLGLTFGSIFGHFFQLYLPITQGLITIFGLAGMAAIFAGSIRGPVTAVVIIVEITGTYELILPIFISVILSFLVSSKFSHEDLYTKSVTDKGIILVDSFADIMDAIPVSKAMIPVDKVKIVTPDMKCIEVLEMIKNSDFNGFPVVDNNQLKGIVTLHDLFDLHLENDCEITVAELLNRKNNPNIYCIECTSHLNHAIAIMMMKQISRIPVIKKSNENHVEFIGWLTLQDIEQAYSNVQSDIDPIELKNHLVEI